MANSRVNKSSVIRNIQNTQFTANGVHYAYEPKQYIKVRHNRVIKTQPSPKIYVNDGSNGTNLRYCESYKLYTTSPVTPRVTSSYSNNFPRNETKNTVYDSTDGTKLDKYGEFGGYSDYSTIRVK